MQTKILEIRDVMTTIGVLCVNMNPDRPYPVNASMSEAELEQSLANNRNQLYWLRREGFPCDGRPNIMMTYLRCDGYATNDPYGWPGGSETLPQAHMYIIVHWDELHDGDVVDVEFITGKTTAPKKPEREERMGG